MSNVKWPNRNATTLFILTVGSGAASLVLYYKAEMLRHKKCAEAQVDDFFGISDICNSYEWFTADYIALFLFIFSIASLIRGVWRLKADAQDR